jgi:hypothetical protein
MRFILKIFMLALAVASLGGLASAKTRPAKGPKAVRLSAAAIVLSGPWKISAGDDPRYADASFKDGGWATSAPGVAADSRGDPAGPGIIWYRLHVPLADEGALAIAGPARFEGAYQLYANGTLVGGAGAFPDGESPKAYSPQPRLLSLPITAPTAKSSKSARTRKRAMLVLALRVWTPPNALPDAFGSAPTLGRAESIAWLVSGQWLQLIEAHLGDLFEAMSLFALAGMAASLGVARPHDQAYSWLLGGLLLIAAQHGNVALFAWTQFETAPAFHVINGVLLGPLAIGAWTMAWRFWLGAKFGGERLSAIVFGVAAVGVGLLIALSFGAAPWQRPAGPSQHLFTTIVGDVRIALAVVYLLVLTEGLVRRRTVSAALACLTAVIVGLGLFGDELTRLGLPATGLSYGVSIAHAVWTDGIAIPALFAVMLERFVTLAQEGRPAAPAPDLWGAPPAHAHFKPQAASWVRSRAAAKEFDQG